MNEEETWLENRIRKKDIGGQPAFLIVVSWDLMALAGAPDGMTFFADVDFMVTI